MALLGNSSIKQATSRPRTGSTFAPQAPKAPATYQPATSTFQQARQSIQQPAQQQPAVQGGQPITQPTGGYMPPPPQGSQTAPPTSYVPTTPAPGSTAPGPYPGGTTYETANDVMTRQESKDQGMNPKEYAAYRQQQLFGSMAPYMPISSDRPMNAADVAAWEMNMNWQQQMMAEADRQRGYGELVRGREAIGNDPYSRYVQDSLRGQYESGGPFTQDLMGQLEGGARGESMRGLQAAMEAARSGFARRGLAGGLSDYQQANMQSQAAGPLAQQIAQMRMQGTMANQAALEQAMQQMQQQAQQQEAMRYASDQALANVFLDTERAPIDASSLINQLGKKQGRKAVSGTV